MTLSKVEKSKLVAEILGEIMRASKGSRLKERVLPQPKPFDPDEFERSQRVATSCEYHAITPLPLASRKSSSSARVRGRELKAALTAV